MKTRVYQWALVVVILACMILAATLIYVLRMQHPERPVSADQNAILARGPQFAERTRASDATPAPDSEMLLAPVQLPLRRLQEIGVTTAAVELKDVSQAMMVPGNVDIDEQRLVNVQTRFAGWIQNVFANATYQYVRKGQRLFTIYSPDIVSSEQEYLLARKNQQSVSQKAESIAAKESTWLLESAEERLRQFGVSAQQIAALKQTGEVQHDIPVDAPASGYVLERNALPNAYIQPETKIYTLADLSTVWVYANVFQNDVGRLKPGDPAQVTADSYPGKQFKGRIDQILPQVDMTTRTVRVRLVLSNPGVVLKPGMYVNVTIAVPMGRQLVIPSSAVLQTGTQTIAFIDHGGGNLEPRAIKTGPQVDDKVIVLGGLEPGEHVVSSANFLVDSAAQLQAAFHPTAQQGYPLSSPGTGQAEQMRIDLTTEPAPPRKGSNTIRVHLSDANGKALVGCQVKVTFFMPAMPTMGMAAMRTTAALEDKGNGMYKGDLQLQSGGAWQVTIEAQRGGATIATKQLSLNATGVM